MLSELSIKNFAIIDDLSIRLADGLTIFSGETGAGKSIIINAVNLVLGSRATAKMIRTGAESAELSALFYLPGNSPARSIIADQGYGTGGGNGADSPDELIIRRIISANNRHKVYINDRPATMQLLASVTENLAAISGQHEHQRLLKEARHLLFLDQFAGLAGLRNAVYEAYHETLPLLRKLEALQNDREKQDEHLELLKFQKQEIEDAGIAPDEDEKLKAEQARLKNAEFLYQSLAGAIEALYSGDGAVSERLSEVDKAIGKAAGIDEELSPASETLTDITVRVEDVAEQLRGHLDSLSFDERRLEEIQARLDQLTRLKRKYGSSLADVLAYHEKIESELEGLENIETAITDAENALDESRNRLAEKCRELSEKRRAAADALAKQMEAELASLKMENTRFSVLVEPIPAGRESADCLTLADCAITETGTERARFMIAPNPGEALRPLSAIASGGELSRVILALKAIMTDSDTAGTLIFDEVDAGIGGEVAEMVGKKLAELAGLHQVICITHLAQIAKFGRHHYKITKEIEDERTRTLIQPLSEEARIEETARMISGADITPTTRQHAREMLLSNSGNSEDRSQESED